jgi:hypothetical protein
MFANDLYLAQRHNNRKAQEGLNAYRGLRLRAEAGRMLGLALGGRRGLRRLAEAPAGTASYAGLQAVPIAAIRGSEGRSDDFDRDFNPLSDETRDRWLSVYAAMRGGRGLPPVELVEAGGVYYVRDGHHRISVARALGQAYVEAVVTRRG